MECCVIEIVVLLLQQPTAPLQDGLCERESNQPFDTIHCHHVIVGSKATF